MAPVIMKFVVEGLIIAAGTYLIAVGRIAEATPVLGLLFLYVYLTPYVMMLV